MRVTKDGRQPYWVFLLLSFGKGAGFCVLTAWLFYRSVWFLLFLPLFLFVSYREGKRQRRESEAETEEKLFSEFLGFLKEAMNAGFSLERSVSEARNGLLSTYSEKEPFLSALHRLMQKLTLSVPVEQGFSELAKECVTEDISDFCEVLYLAKRTGGTVTKVITNTERVLVQKQETRMQIRAVLHSRLYEIRLMKAMPFAMLCYLNVCLPGFLDPLYHTAFGVFLMSVVLLLFAFLCYLIDRISKIRISERM